MRFTFQRQKSYNPFTYFFKSIAYILRQHVRALNFFCVALRVVFKSSKQDAESGVFSNPANNDQPTRREAAKETGTTLGYKEDSGDTRRPASYKIGMSIADFFISLDLCYNALILAEKCYETPGVYLKKYAEYLIQLKTVLVNLPVTDLKDVEMRRNFIEVLDDKFIRAFFLSENIVNNRLKDMADGIEEGFRWGTQVGYINGYLYAYESLGALHPENGTLGLKTLLHKIRAATPPLENPQKPQYFSMQREVLISRIQEYIRHARNTPTTTGLKTPENLSSSGKPELLIFKEKRAAYKRRLQEAREKIQKEKKNAADYGNQVRVLQKQLDAANAKVLVYKSKLESALDEVKVLAVNRDASANQEEKLITRIAELQKQLAKWEAYGKNAAQQRSKDKKEILRLTARITALKDSANKRRRVEHEIFKIEGNLDIFHKLDIKLLKPEKYFETLNKIKESFNMLVCSCENEDIPEDLMLAQKGLYDRLVAYMNVSFDAPQGPTPPGLALRTSPEQKEIQFIGEHVSATSVPKSVKPTQDTFKNEITPVTEKVTTPITNNLIPPTTSQTLIDGGSTLLL